MLFADEDVATADRVFYRSAYTCESLINEVVDFVDKLWLFNVGGANSPGFN